MSSLIPAAYAGFSSALDRALDQRSVKLTYAAFVAAGTQSVLVQSQAQATKRQFLMLGNASAGMSLAIAQTICAPSNETPITSAYDTNQAALAVGMVTYFTAIPAAADAANCYGFAIGGLNCTDIFTAVLRNYRRTSTSAVNPSDNLINVNAATPIGGFSLTQPGNNAAITLNGSNQILLQDGTTALDYGTNTLVVCPAYGVIFGSFSITDVTDAANANDILELEVYFK